MGDTSRSAGVGVVVVDLVRLRPLPKRGPRWFVRGAGCSAEVVVVAALFIGDMLFSAFKASMLRQGGRLVLSNASLSSVDVSNGNGKNFSRLGGGGGIILTPLLLERSPIPPVVAGALVLGDVFPSSAGELEFQSSGLRVDVGDITSSDDDVLGAVHASLLCLRR